MVISIHALVLRIYMPGTHVTSPPTSPSLWFRVGSPSSIISVHSFYIFLLCKTPSRGIYVKAVVGGKTFSHVVSAIDRKESLGKSQASSSPQCAPGLALGESSQVSLTPAKWTWQANSATLENLV